MNNKVLIAAGVLVALAIGVGVWTFMRAPKQPSDQPLPPGYQPTPVKPIPSPVVPPPINEPMPVPPERTISANKSYSNGTYYLAGNIEMPTPCHKLDVQARIMESFPEQVALDFTITDSGEICVQVIDNRDWTLQVKVSEQATFSARINGQPATLVWETK